MYRNMQPLLSNRSENITIIIFLKRSILSKTDAKQFITVVTQMSIRFYTVNLTRIDSRMKVSLKGLPDTLRGDAWPTSACVVR